VAACDLMIQLEDTEPRSGGAPISGTVVVKANKDVQCNGLTVTVNWSTHGRGNVDTGVVSEITLPASPWQAGQEYRYPFKLATAVWPPTYYGSYLNVSHYVSARAKIPWAKDPSASVEFAVVAKDAPADLTPTVKTPKATWPGWVLGLIVLVFVLAAFSFLLLIVVPIFALGAAGYWLFRVFLPQQVTGKVECSLASERVRAGEPLRATLRFTPRKTSTINGIQWKIHCFEEVVSGSGSNRKTHRNDLLDVRRVASETMQLQAGRTETFELAYQLSPLAAPTLKFSDNHIKWVVEARIDIPKWPDFVKSLSVTVLPNPDTIPNVSVGQPASDDSEDSDDAWDEDDAFAEAQSGATANLPHHSAGGYSENGDTADGYREDAEADFSQDDLWFGQVLEQLQSHQHDPAQLSTIVQAVSGYVFPISATLETRIDPPMLGSATVVDRFNGAVWWAAYFPRQNANLGLAWIGTHPRLDSGQIWQGQATIVGYDPGARRVLMRTQ
jgi:hypothetical protein